MLATDTGVKPSNVRREEAKATQNAKILSLFTPRLTA
jgi:hypothetical protein